MFYACLVRFICLHVSTGFTLSIAFLLFIILYIHIMHTASFLL